MVKVSLVTLFPSGTHLSIPEKGDRKVILKYDTIFIFLPYNVVCQIHSFVIKYQAKTC